MISYFVFTEFYEAFEWHAKGTQVSTIVDMSTAAMKIVRKGPINACMLEKAL